MQKISDGKGLNELRRCSEIYTQYIKIRLQLGLQNITELLKLGDPIQPFLPVHIAGTNGKGSVSAMIAGMLHQAGYRVGLFISLPGAFYRKNPGEFKRNSRMTWQTLCN